MKFAIVLVGLFAVALSKPLDNPAQAQVVRYDNDNIGVEGYKFAVETSDGKAHSEEGQLKNVGTDNEGIAVHGQFSYVGDDGVTYTLSYIADENGFQPTGNHLPVGPEP